MGYDGTIFTKVELDKAINLLNKSKKFIIIKSFRSPTLEEMNTGKITVGVHEGSLVTYDMDTPKLWKFLDKNKIKY